MISFHSLLILISLLLAFACGFIHVTAFMQAQERARKSARHFPQNVQARTQRIENLFEQVGKTNIPLGLRYLTRENADILGLHHARKALLEERRILDLDMTFTLRTTCGVGMGYVYEEDFTTVTQLLAQCIASNTCCQDVIEELRTSGILVVWDKLN